MTKRSPAFAAPLGALAVSLLLGCRGSGSGRAAEAGKAAPPSQEAPMAASKSAHPEAVLRLCAEAAGPAPVLVKALKDSAGRIGGYTHTVRIPDSPIYYLDAEGRDYAMFHIFGTDEEKAKNQPLIDKLRKAYPLEEPLACP